MSVNHYLLPITGDELGTVLKTPERIRKLVKEHRADVQELGEDGPAIVALTAESGKDPLAFLMKGAPGAVSGRVGKYVVDDGRVVECEIDMGYGPASYYRNKFLAKVARRLEPITADLFADHCDLDWLEENVYPAGWHERGRKKALVKSFDRYRACVMAAAKSGQHLLVWCA